jgi:hypothetical protein
MCAATASRRVAAADMAGTAIDIAEELARLPELTIFEQRGEWRRLIRMPPQMRPSRGLLIQLRLRIRAFAAKSGLDFCRKGRIGGVTGAGQPGADFSGLASRNAGLWVVGAPIGARP